MKFLIVYSALLVGALAFERWGPGEFECANKLNTTIKTIQDIPYPAVEDNTVLNNFMLCAWKKRGLLSDDGNVNWDVLQNLLLSKDYLESSPLYKSYETFADWKDFVQGVINKCRDVRGDTDGQTVVKVQNCFLQHGFSKDG
ncbi:hypothetical protein ILUMI_10221 [Ignelater luminosus]|uniref:Uncharacterized protein n=1 Tax=Ignelater luminosus TaxID=2038154 RepID=A0A8K0CYA8_IGNLU|nr:hypothetical protein ILUMI_10221 [Ignelater luminosus]